MMIAVYKRFTRARIVFCAFLALFFLNMAPAHSEETYTVEGVEIDVTAENAVKARIQALDEAQIEAYKILANRLLGEEGAQGFENPDPITAGSLVKDFEVTNEQLSAVRYKGVFTVRFHPRSSERHFMIVDHTAYDQHGETMYDPYAPSSHNKRSQVSGVSKTLVLPFYQYGSRTTIWDDLNNKWMRTWRNTYTSQALVVPIGDALDVGQVRNDQSLTYNYDFLKGMMRRYDAHQTLVLIATERLKPDGTVTLEVNSYAASEGGPIFRGAKHYESRVGEAPGLFFKRVVSALSADIERTKHQPNTNDVKAQAFPNHQDRVYPSQDGLVRDARVAPPLGQVATYKGRAVYESARGWVDLKKALESASGTKAVLVKGLKPRMADIELKFAGDVKRLSTVMALEGISVRTVQPKDTVGRVIENAPAVFEFVKTPEAQKINNLSDGVERRSRAASVRESYYR